MTTTKKIKNYYNAHNQFVSIIQIFDNTNGIDLRGTFEALVEGTIEIRGNDYTSVRVEADNITATQVKEALRQEVEDEDDLFTIALIKKDGLQSHILDMITLNLAHQDASIWTLEDIETPKYIMIGIKVGDIHQPHPYETLVKYLQDEILALKEMITLSIEDGEPAEIQKAYNSVISSYTGMLYILNSISKNNIGYVYDVFHGSVAESYYEEVK